MPRGHGSMREPLEMVCSFAHAKLVQIRNKNTYFGTKLLFIFLRKKVLEALGVESPHGGAIDEEGGLMQSLTSWFLADSLQILAN